MDQLKEMIHENMGEVRGNITAKPVTVIELEFVDTSGGLVLTGQEARKAVAKFMKKHKEKEYQKAKAENEKNR